MSLIDAKFPMSYWDTKLSVRPTVLKFLQNKAWLDLELTPAIPTDEAKLRAELDALLKLQKEERPGKQADILLEDKDPTFRFQNLLIFDPRSAPRTYGLMQGMLEVGTYVALHFKFKFQRARPSQLDPEIRPSITVPMHAAYPSGHSLQMHLMAHGLAAVIPAFEKPLFEIAMSVARNREIAGVHYPSDTLVSRNLAAEIYKMAEPVFQEWIDAAKQEWKNVYPNDDEASTEGQAGSPAGG